MSTRNLILSIVVGLWGAAILVRTLVIGGPEGGDGSAYRAGSIVALVLAVVMLIAGVRGVLTELSRRDQTP